jgi:hypothetical protein
MPSTVTNLQRDQDEKNRQGSDCEFGIFNLSAIIDAIGAGNISHAHFQTLIFAT